MAKNILIVGGAGYVGSALTDILLATDHTIRVYDSLLYDDECRTSVDFVRGDIRDHEKLLPHLHWADVVVWLAAIVGDGACALYPDVTREVNSDAVSWLAEHYDGRIIFPSTSMVYGAQAGALTEKAPLAPVSLYAQTKYAAEVVLTRQHALIFRFATLFGMGSESIRPRFDLVVHLFVRAAISGKPITVFGGEQMRAIVHVRDVAQTIATHVETDAQGIFNLHCDNVRVRDIAERVRSIIPGTVVQLHPSDAVVSGNYGLSSAKAEHVLGFHPLRTLDDGIREVSAYSREHLNNLYDPRYSNEAYLQLHPLHIWNNHD